MRVTSPPKTERQKKYLRTVRGTKLRWSKDLPTKPYRVQKEMLPEYIACSKNFSLPRLRGRSGTRLSEANRLKLQEKLEARRAFFAELGVVYI
jgi:hypothetical protein